MLGLPTSLAHTYCIEDTLSVPRRSELIPRRRYTRLPSRPTSLHHSTVDSRPGNKDDWSPFQKSPELNYQLWISRTMFTVLCLSPHPAIPTLSRALLPQFATFRHVLYGVVTVASRALEQSRIRPHWGRSRNAPQSHFSLLCANFSSCHVGRVSTVYPSMKHPPRPF